MDVTILHIVSIFNVFLAYISLRGRLGLISISFSIVTISVALWSLFISFFIKTSELENALIYANMYYISAAMVAASFLFFSILFTSKIKATNYKHILLFSPILILIALFIYDKNILVEEVFRAKWGKDVSLNTYLYTFYALYFLSYVTYTYKILINGFKNSTKREERKQILYIIAGTITAYIGGMTANLLLPWLGNYQYIWLGPPSSILMILAITYSIIKYNLFNIKIIATEALTFTLWIFIFIRIILSENSQDQLINSGLLLITIIIGILLIMSVRKEVETRQKIESLAENLKSANKKLEEISQQKSEFVSIATHQLRSPVSAIRGYSSMILEGSFGKTPQKISEAVDRIYQSSSNLSIIIEDFLNLSRIEQGRIKYEFEKSDVKKLLEETVAEVKSNILKKGLKLDFDYKKHTDYESNIDVGKIKQVFSNIIDNAVKYTPEGFLKISIEKKDGSILVSFKDSGIGIHKDTIPKLFQKFSRDSDAHKTNIHGTGLGLYVVKEIINAHKGKVWVESKGEGEGSQFYVQLKSNQ